MTAFFTGVFIVVIVAHLIGCIAKNNKVERATKPLLMPLLAATAATYLTPYISGSVRIPLLLVTALFFGWLGDILLLGEGNPLFAAGAGAFLVGHILYITIYSSIFSASPLPIPGTATGIAICLVYVIFGYNFIGKPKGVMGVAISIYAFVLCLLNFFTISALIIKPSSAALCGVAGSLLFLCSDSMLGYKTFRKDFPISHFLVMSTYIAAQILLTAGVAIPVMQR